MAGSIRGFEVDTRYFTGNFAPRISIQATRLTPEAMKRTKGMQKRADRMGTKADADEYEAVSVLKSDEWDTLVPMHSLTPGYAGESKSFFELTGASSQLTYTHIRLNLFPDGGVARFRTFGVAAPNLRQFKFDMKERQRDIKLSG